MYHRGKPIGLITFLRLITRCFFCGSYIRLVVRLYVHLLRFPVDVVGGGDGGGVAVLCAMLLFFIYCVICIFKKSAIFRLLMHHS